MPLTKQEQRVAKLKRRMMVGTEQSPDAELKQAQDVLAWALRKHGVESAFSLKAMLDVATQLGKLDRWEEEIDLRTQIVAGLRQHDPDSVSTAAAEMQLARCLAFTERRAEAEPLLRHVVEIRQRELGEDDPETERAQRALASVAGPPA